MPVKIEVKSSPADNNGVCVAAAEGRLDLVSAATFRSRLGAIIDDGCPEVVVDLSAITFVDSSGLGALVAGLKAARKAGGDMRICGANEQVRMVLGLTNLDKVFRMFEQAEDAVASF